jgi:hypothetical protein
VASRCESQIPNLGNGETPVDCFYLCDEELLVPVQGDRQDGISSRIWVADG